jgi:hypothetical protein
MQSTYAMLLCIVQRIIRPYLCAVMACIRVMIVSALEPICDMFLPSIRDATMMQLATRQLFTVAVVVMSTLRIFHQRRRMAADREAKGERQQATSSKQATGFIMIVQGPCICRMPSRRVQYNQFLLGILGSN